MGSLSAETKVLALAGSTRDDSLNKKLMFEAAQAARQLGGKVTVIDLSDYPMPFYDADLEAREGMPFNAKRFRRYLMESDAIIIATPEYNGSIPAVLKNAIDWASRSEDGQPSFEAFKGKRFALLSASPGRGGGVRAVKHLKDILEGVGGVVVVDQVSVPNAHAAFNEKGALANQQIRQQIKQEIGQAIRR